MPDRQPACGQPFASICPPARITEQLDIDFPQSRDDVKDLLASLGTSQPSGNAADRSNPVFVSEQLLQSDPYTIAGPPSEYIEKLHQVVNTQQKSIDAFKMSAEESTMQLYSIHKTGKLWNAWSNRYATLGFLLSG